MAIVFGSPEARKIIEKDRKKFGPPDTLENAHEVEHVYELYVECEATVERRYQITAYSEEAALAIWREGGGELIDEDIVDIDRWGKESIEDTGEAIR